MRDSDSTSGVVSGCTVEDRPAPWDLYANDPLASGLDIVATLKNAEIGSWAVYRDKANQIRVAVFMHPDGNCRLVMKPEDMSDSEVKNGFLRLAGEVHRAFKINGITDLKILCPERLITFMQTLRREGFVSREVYSVHGDRKVTQWLRSWRSAPASGFRSKVLQPPRAQKHPPLPHSSTKRTGSAIATIMVLSSHPRDRQSRC